MLKCQLVAFVDHLFCLVAGMAKKILFVLLIKKMNNLYEVPFNMKGLVITSSTRFPSLNETDERVITEMYSELATHKQRARGLR